VLVYGVCTVARRDARRHEHLRSEHPQLEPPPSPARHGAIMGEVGCFPQAQTPMDVRAELRRRGCTLRWWRIGRRPEAKVLTVSDGVPRAPGGGPGLALVERDRRRVRSGRAP
jgi:hypothetical protein